MNTILRKIKSNKLKIAVGAVMLSLGTLLFSVLPAAAEDALTIVSINATATRDTATIFWDTNRNASAKLEYGKEAGRYLWTVVINTQRDHQAVTLTGLQRDTKYYFKITAFTSVAEVQSFERTFETLDEGDAVAPVIKDVRIEYLTGTSATVQWFTDKPASTVVRYGQDENNLDKSVSANGKTLTHDITLKNLKPGALYYYRAESKDEDNNLARWATLSFRTFPTENAERDPLLIYSVQPIAENDPLIGETTAVIKWRTNKLAEATVRYGEGTSLNKSIKTTAPRQFDPTVTLIDLKPGARYSYQIEARDVFGVTLKSTGHSFLTRSSAPPTDRNTDVNSGATGSSGAVLGDANCAVDLQSEFGHFGLYYNLPESHPDTGLWKGKDIASARVARENDWYNAEYFAFSRVDQNLDFGNRWLPVDQGKAGDPYLFAVNWRSIVEVPADGTYSFSIKSDDDSWVFVDDQLVSDLGGIHKAKTLEKSLQLTKGYHVVQVYYAERSPRGAIMSFVPDTRLKFHPLPEGCTLDNVLNSQGRGPVNASTDTSAPTPAPGVVLGVSTDDALPANPAAAVCSNDRGYTKITALYKTAASPDIWAILETGQKHYITSPESFNEYGCRWGAIQIVSLAKLNSYQSANLVRTPGNATIYHLFQRPNRKWLKITIPSPTVFISYPENFWGNVARINQFDMDSYPHAQLIRLTGNDTIYKIENGLKRKFVSRQVFEAHGYDLAEVVDLNDIHMDSFEDGAIIQ